MVTKIRDEGQKNQETIEILKGEMKEENRRRKREKAELVKIFGIF